MAEYTQEELAEALRAINSIIHKCEKAQEKFPDGNSHHTLLRNRLKAMYISKALITELLFKKAQPTTAKSDCSVNQLILNLDKLHSTKLGLERIKSNLRLDSDDVVGWCKEKIRSPDSSIMQEGKNWYITIADCKITVNASSYTIITAHSLTR